MIRSAQVKRAPRHGNMGSARPPRQQAQNHAAHGCRTRTSRSSNPVWTHGADHAKNFGYMVWGTCLFAKDRRPQDPADDGGPLHGVRRQSSPTNDRAARRALSGSDGHGPGPLPRIASPRSSAGPARDPYGQLPDERPPPKSRWSTPRRFAIRAQPAVRLRDRRPWPRSRSNVPFMMPKRIAATDPQKHDPPSFIGLRPLHLQSEDEWKGPAKKDRLREEPRAIKPRARSRPFDAGPARKIAKVDRRRMAGHSRSQHGQ